ncbi:hypothetical protein N9917_04405 [Deltaproteobacteria bacterium]|nr:hypothetical protein [Deltaproteobacteria bacterium]
MTGSLSLPQMLKMMRWADVTEIRWDGRFIETEPAGRDEKLHIDLRKTIEGSTPFTLTQPEAP